MIEIKEINIALGSIVEENIKIEKNSDSRKVQFIILLE